MLLVPDLPYFTVNSVFQAPVSCLPEGSGTAVKSSRIYRQVAATR